MPFNGLAVFSPTHFDSLAEDVSDMVGIISPAETPLLDLLGTSGFDTTNILHEWLEDALNPTTISNSEAVASTAADTALGIAGGYASQLRVGQIVLMPGLVEYARISVIAGNTITVQRGFGGTLANSFGANLTLRVISDAALEGDDITGDTSTPRPRRSNYVQIYKKDVVVSGTRQAVANLAGVTDEFGYQKANRLKEMLRDLNKSVILSILSGNTIGTAAAPRTMRGLRASITTNVQSIGTITDSYLGNLIKAAWDNGGVDVDAIVIDSAWKRLVDNLNGSRIRTVNNENRFRNLIQEYEGTYGTQRVVLDRWMLPNTAFAISTNRIKVVPLRGRTFQYMDVARTGDSMKGFIVGEYTLEVKNEDGLSRGF